MSCHTRKPGKPKNCRRRVWLVFPPVKIKPLTIKVLESVLGHGSSTGSYVYLHV